MMFLATGVVNILMLTVFCLSWLTFELAYNYLSRVIKSSIFTGPSGILQLYFFYGWEHCSVVRSFVLSAITIQYVGNGAGRP